MKKDQLFKKNPSNELFQKVLNAFGLTDLNDKRLFSRKDLQYIKTVNKINELKQKPFLGLYNHNQDVNYVAELLQPDPTARREPGKPPFIVSHSRLKKFGYNPTNYYFKQKKHFPNILAEQERKKREKELLQEELRSRW